MAFDWGYVIAGAVIFWIVAMSYKKKTGKPISELWKNKEGNVIQRTNEFRRVYVTKGIKQ